MVQFLELVGPFLFLLPNEVIWVELAKFFCDCEMMSGYTQSTLKIKQKNTQNILLLLTDFHGAIRFLVVVSKVFVIP